MVNLPSSNPLLPLASDFKVSLAALLSYVSETGSLLRSAAESSPVCPFAVQLFICSTVMKTFIFYLLMSKSELGKGSP